MAVKIPVSVITGFLGAGKTTLLNRLLRAPELADALVIVNEWGDIGLDHLLIEKVEGDVILMSSGCLCCALRGDLVDALADVGARRDEGRIAPFNRVVIETSGLADPAPILQAIAGDAGLAARFRLAGVVALVDAVNGAATLRRSGESVRQVAWADCLALAKTDLLVGADRLASLAALQASLRALNPLAPILDVAAGELRAADLIALDPGADSFPMWDVEPLGGRPSPPRHSGSISAHSLRLADPVSAPAFAAFLGLLHEALGPRLLRVKGLIALAEHPTEPLVIHGVQHIFHSSRRLTAWPSGDRSTRIVLIVDGVDPAAIERLWAALSGAPRIDAPDLAALADNPLRRALGGLLA